MTGRNSRQAGFTLLEMLVAMALFSFVLACFGALFLDLQRTNAVIRRVERSEDVDLVRRFLRHSLEAARAHSRVGADGIRRVHFLGEPGRIVFVVVADGDHETGGVYETELRLDEAGRLLLQRRPLDWGGNMDPAPEVLLENLASLTFSYAPCPTGAATGAAAPRWSRADQLPFRISVAATFRDGDPRVWQDLSTFVPAAACSGAM